MTAEYGKPQEHEIKTATPLKPWEQQARIEEGQTESKLKEAFDSFGGHMIGNKTDIDLSQSEDILTSKVTHNGRDYDAVVAYLDPLDLEQDGYICAFEGSDQTTVTITPGKASVSYPVAISLVPQDMKYGEKLDYTVRIPGVIPTFDCSSGIDKDKGYIEQWSSGGKTGEHLLFQSTHADIIKDIEIIIK